MPKVDRSGPPVPPGVRPFTHHGISLRLGVGDNQALGDCPFCGKEDKLYVNQDSGLWECHACQESGNPVGLLRRLWEAFGFPEQPGSSLAAERRLRAPQTLESWGVRWSTTTEEWVVPFYNSQGLLSQLCRYALVGDRWMLLPTPSAELGIHDGVAGALDSDSLGEAADTIYLCEKPWDAMCLWETMKDTDQHEAVSVLSLRTASTWHPSYAPLLAGKKVVLLFDNDHHRVNKQTGKQILGAGYQATRKVSASLAGLTPPAAPSQIAHLAWGEEGYDPALPSGYDLRDWIPNFGEPGDGVFTTMPSILQENLKLILDRIKPVPDSWLEDGKVAASARKGQLEIRPKKCESWQELRAAFEEALHWTPGLDRAMTVVLAVSTSVDMPGDQVWMRLVCPPSGGKTVICEAVSTSRKYVKAKSKIKSFFSGYQTDKEGSEDLSLVVQINGKMLVTKDGDTLLQSATRDTVMAEARDIYDGSFRTSFLNKMSREYSNHRTAWLLAGTDALSFLDTSELGERFLTVRIMDRIDEEAEDRIGDMAIDDVFATRGISASSGEGQHSPKMRKAMSLAGGYVEYLRENAQRLLSRVRATDAVKDDIKLLGKFIAYMRARPSRKHDERSDREISTRLRKQLAKLSLCLAVTLQTGEIDTEVMGRIRSVAMDTARGRPLDVVRELRRVGRRSGMGVEDLADAIKHPSQERLYMLLRFMDGQEVVERFQPDMGAGVKARPRWRVTKKMLELYDRVMSLGGQS
jgi:hypothetical protein